MTKKDEWVDKKRPKITICRHPEHDPPMHLYIPPGETRVHRCPACGFEIEMHGSEIVY